MPASTCMALDISPSGMTSATAVERPGGCAEWRFRRCIIAWQAVGKPQRRHVATGSRAFLRSQLVPQYSSEVPCPSGHSRDVLQTFCRHIGCFEVQAFIIDAGLEQVFTRLPVSCAAGIDLASRNRLILRKSLAGEPRNYGVVWKLSRTQSIQELSFFKLRLH